MTTNYEQLPDPFDWKKCNDIYPKQKLTYDPTKPEKDRGVLYHILKQTDKETVDKIFDDIAKNK